MTKLYSLPRFAVAFAVSIAMLAGPATQRASATPPDIVTVNDTLLGASETELFVLRSTWDNLGSHFEARTEVWLVAIDVQSGEETLWPVHGVTQTTDFGEGPEDERRVLVPDETGDAVNPFVIMTERGAMPRLGRAGRAKIDAHRTAAKVTFGYNGGQTHALAIASALDRFHASIANLGGKVKAAGRTGTLPTREYYEGLQFDADTCSFEAAGRPVYVFPSDRSWQPVRVTCANAEVLENSSLIQIAPMIEADATAR